jgi:hypothetical protein
MNARIRVYTPGLPADLEGWPGAPYRHAGRVAGRVVQAARAGDVTTLDLDIDDHVAACEFAAGHTRRYAIDVDAGRVTGVTGS